MSVVSLIATCIPAALAVGGGLYKLGSGLVAMSGAVRQLVKLGEDHEARIKALENSHNG
jgi:hypothetical protein